MGDPNPLHAVVFRVGGLVCALPAGEVREILPAGPATRIPGAAPAVQGLVNVRGRLVTVVDVHPLLGQPSPAEPALLLLERRGPAAGLSVGEVLDFLEVPPTAVADRDILPGVDGRVVAGTGEWAGHRFILLDSDALLAPLLGA
ncbi:MAG TPA: chemotaxis protein CheW [Gemmatimonadales bacterium]|nr:chemotaxis protein CheW [Gemmatimonadales bacterium]